MAVAILSDLSDLFHECSRKPITTQEQMAARAMAADLLRSKDVPLAAVRRVFLALHFAFNG